MSENTQDMMNDKGLEALQEAENAKMNEQMERENEETNKQYEELETHTSKQYDASNIRVLEGLEAVRDLGCISVQLPKEVCTIVFMKLLIIQLMNHWQDFVQIFMLLFTRITVLL